MAKHGKNYRNKLKSFDSLEKYAVGDAVAKVKELSYVKFDETVTLDIRLGVDPRNADQQVRGTCALPHGTGKTVRVAVFAAGAKAAEAEAAGADVVGGEDLVKKILDGFLDFDAAIATPDMMRFVGRLGKVLGPRGMMPNPKVGTVTMNVGAAVEALKAGQVEYRLDRFAIIHVPVGKMSFELDKLTENVEAMIDAVNKAKPSAAKGTYMKSVTLSGTMTPGVKINPPSAAKAGREG